jgi:predicted metal-dependent phosphoesterase TrpH
MFTAPILDRICRESYNDPREVYNRLKRLGMSIVTLTDHDSIEGAEALRRYPDFFLSEEVTVRMPSGTETHLGVYGLTERDHVEIQRRRTDFIALLITHGAETVLSARTTSFGAHRAPRSGGLSVVESYVPVRSKRGMDKCGGGERQRR